MPIYRYRCASGDCFLCGGVVDLFQNRESEPHTTCPYCRQDVERIFGVPQKHIVNRADQLKDSHVAAQGFSKYVNAGDGKFELAAGPDEAPKVLDRANIERNVDLLFDED